MRIRFWGTRGGIAVPGPATLRYGGNTSCVEVVCGPHRIILDAGTGLRNLGKALLAANTPVTADLLLSHFHLDHLVGLGFFTPLYRSDTALHIHAGVPAEALKASLTASLSAPLMPDLLGMARASLRFSGFVPNDRFDLHPGLAVATTPCRHPGGSVAYRIEWQGRSLTYVTDTEHAPDGRDPDILRLAQGTDLLIYDSSYTDAEFADHIGWGHSTWQEAIRMADAAGAGKLVLFHHDAARTDAELDAIGKAAAAQRPGTLVAAEEMVLDV